MGYVIGGLVGIVLWELLRGFLNYATRPDPDEDDAEDDDWIHRARPGQWR